MNVFVIHGPNLNMLGKREVSVYGDVDLETINTTIMAAARGAGPGPDPGSTKGGRFGRLRT